MASANVELVRGMYEAYARGDYAKGLSYLDPEIVFSQPSELRKRQTSDYIRPPASRTWPAPRWAVG